MRAYSTVDYEEGTDDFECIRIEYGKKTIKFDSGDPLIDWFQYYRFIYSGGAKKYGIESIGVSSSIDHWFMDTNRYVEHYLKEVGDGKYDFMTTRDISELSLSDMGDCIKCVASKGMKSFQEVRDYYFDYIQKLSLHERLDRAYIDNIKRDGKKYLVFEGKEIPRPNARDCENKVKSNFDIQI